MTIQAFATKALGGHIFLAEVLGISLPRFHVAILDIHNDVMCYFECDKSETRAIPRCSQFPKMIFLWSKYS